MLIGQENYDIFYVRLSANSGQQLAYKLQKLRFFLIHHFDAQLFRVRGKSL